MQQDRRRQGKLWLSVLTAICGLPVILDISDALWLEAIALSLFACLVVLILVLVLVLVLVRILGHILLIILI